MEPKINLLQYSGDYMWVDGKYHFGKLNSEDYITLNQSISIINPSYEYSFKLLFLEMQCINNITGTKRLQNLLNEILYPEKDEYIENLEYSSNKLYFDICCKCETNKGETIIIYIEMERYIGQNIHKEMFRYGSSLYFQKCNKTIFIVFYLKLKKNKLNSSQIKPHIEFNDSLKKNNDLVEIVILDDLFSIIQIDLDYISYMLIQGKKPKINGKNLNDNGYSWLKFLGIQSWCTGENDYYYLPNNMNISEELNSAITILSSLNIFMYASIIKNEEKKLNIFEEQYKIGFKIGREEGKRYILNKIEIYKNWIKKFKEDRNFNQFDSLPKISNDEFEKIYNLSDFSNDYEFYIECLNKLLENEKLINI